MAKKPVLNFLSESDIQKAMKVLIYGATGSGKSYLAHTMLDDPEMLPALVVVCDNSQITHKDFIGPNYKVINGNRQVLEQLFEILSEPGHEFKSLFIDNLSALQTAMLQESAKITTSGKERSQYTYSPADYGYARNVVYTIVQSYLDSSLVPNMNIIMTAWAEQVTDVATGKKKVDINFSGKLQSEIPGLFSAVGFMETQEPSATKREKAKLRGEELTATRKITWEQSSDIITARCVGNLLGKELIDPTLPKIRRLLMGLEERERQI